jgi:hypothetical protein
MLPRAVGTAAAALLVLGVAGTALAADPASPAAGSLAVSTVPSGAAVYVDGELQGAAPLSLDLTPGDHRVRLVKQGYLENSRLVDLRSGRADRLTVSLTPVGHAAPAPRAQVEDEYLEQDSDGGGGGKKLLFLGLGAAAAGAGAYVLLRDTNEPPVAGSVSVDPAVALAAVTTVTLSVTGATDPDGDSLTYSWDLGDGSTATGQQVNHTYASEGSFGVTVTVSDGEEQATASGSVTVRSLSGSWTGLGNNVLNFTCQISQSGTSLSGTYSDWAGSGSISGSLTAPNQFNMRTQQSGGRWAVWEGTLDASFDRITGLYIFASDNPRFEFWMARQ